MNNIANDLIVGLLGLFPRRKLVDFSAGTRYSANIIRSKGIYTKSVNDIDTLKVPGNAWSFDIRLVVKMSPSSTVSFPFSTQTKNTYLKFTLDGTRTYGETGWDMTVTRLNEPYNDRITFSITKDGHIQYSSEQDFELKYNTVYI